MSEERESLDDPLADFQASQRKRWRIGMLVTVVVLALAGAGWSWWLATGLQPIDPETSAEISEVMDSLDTMPRELHAQLAAAALVELERERLPEAMVAAFDDLMAVPPSMAGQIAMRPFADDPDSLRAWTVACPAGAQALADYAASGDIDKLFADCQLGRWSLIDGTEARRKSAGRLVLAHATWGWLVDHHSETELERRVLRVFVQG